MTNDAFTFVAVGQSLILRDLRDHRAAGFRALWPIIAEADLAFTNFEATVRGGGTGFPVKDGYCHAAAPEALDTLKAMGFHLLSLSNNHSFDLGPEGVLATLDAVAARGFIAAGTGRTPEEAARAGVGDIAGRRAALVAMDAGPQPPYVYARSAKQGLPARPGVNRLGVTREIVLPAENLAALQAISGRLGHESQKKSRAQSGYYAQPADGFDFYGNRFVLGDRAGERRIVDGEDCFRQLAAIEDAAAEEAFVVAYVHHHHWENDWEEAPAWLGAFARQCIDAGAHAFVSHGIPMALGIELYKGRPIFYSLGNFIYHTQYPEKRAGDDRIWQSVVAQCRYRGGALTGIELTPIMLGGAEALRTGRLEPRVAPERVDGPDAQALLERLRGLSARLGTTIDIRDGRGYITA